VRHFPDLPGREISIEDKSLVKHCTQQQQQKKSKDKNGLRKKKERAYYFKKRISAATERKREIEAAKKRPDLEEGGRVYVLLYMFVTFPTCQVERSPLKAAAY